MRRGNDVDPLIILLNDILEQMVPDVVGPNSKFSMQNNEVVLTLANRDKKHIQIALICNSLAAVIGITKGHPRYDNTMRQLASGIGSYTEHRGENTSEYRFKKDFTDNLRKLMTLPHILEEAKISSTLFAASGMPRDVRRIIIQSAKQLEMVDILLQHVIDANWLAVAGLIRKNPLLMFEAGTAVNINKTKVTISPLDYALMVNDRQILFLFSMAVAGKLSATQDSASIHFEETVNAALQKREISTTNGEDQVGKDIFLQMAQQWLDGKSNITIQMLQYYLQEQTQQLSQRDGCVSLQPISWAYEVLNEFHEKSWRSSKTSPDELIKYQQYWQKIIGYAQQNLLPRCRLNEFCQMTGLDKVVTVDVQNKDNGLIDGVTCSMPICKNPFFSTVGKTTALAIGGREHACCVAFEGDFSQHKARHKVLKKGFFSEASSQVFCRMIGEKERAEDYWHDFKRKDTVMTRASFMTDSQQLIHLDRAARENIEESYRRKSGNDNNEPPRRGL